MTTTEIVMLCIAAFIVGVIVGGVLIALCAASGAADAEIKRETAKQSYQRKKIVKQNRISKSKTALQMVREVEEYNRAHGTCLTYGQYVLKKETIKGGK